MSDSELWLYVRAWDPLFAAEIAHLSRRQGYLALIHRLGIREPHGAELMRQIAQRIADAILVPKLDNA